LATGTMVVPSPKAIIPHLIFPAPRQHAVFFPPRFSLFGDSVTGDQVCSLSPSEEKPHTRVLF